MNGLEEAIEVFGRVAKAEIAERDERIHDLLDQLEASDREKELLRARMDELQLSAWSDNDSLVRED